MWGAEGAVSLVTMDRQRDVCNLRTVQDSMVLATSNMGEAPTEFVTDFAMRKSSSPPPSTYSLLALTTESTFKREIIS